MNHKALFTLHDRKGQKSMNIFISSDIEGTCGVSDWCEAGSGDKDGFAMFREQMSFEVAAACRAAINAGAARVLVKDAHDTARNIDPAVLPEEVQINRGWSGDVYNMMSGMQRGDWDAVAFTGYHAAACSAGNPLSHTMSTSVDEIEINGMRASEFTINAYMAGYHRIPVCFVSGDTALCESARRMIPEIAVVPVSRGDGASSTSLHPALAVKRIESIFFEQLDSGRYQSCMVQMPESFEIVVRYQTHAAAYRASFYPDVTQLDEKTIRYTCADYMDAMRLFVFIL